MIEKNMTEPEIYVARNYGMLVKRLKSGFLVWDRDRNDFVENCGFVGRDNKRVSFNEHCKDVDNIEKKYGLLAAIKYDWQCTVFHLSEIFEFLKFEDYD